MKNKFMKNVPAGLKLLLVAFTLLLSGNVLNAQHHRHGQNDDSTIVWNWNDTAFHFWHDSIPPVVIDTGNNSWHDTTGNTGGHAGHHRGGNIQPGGGQYTWGNDSSFLHWNQDTTGQTSPDSTSQGWIDTTGHYPADTLPQSWIDTIGHLPGDTLMQGWNDSTGQLPGDTLPQGWNDSTNHLPGDTLPHCNTDTTGQLPPDSLQQGWNDTIANVNPGDSTTCHGGHRNLTISSGNAQTMPAGLLIYPNPMRQNATLSIVNAVNAVTFRMFESTGRPVMIKSNLTNGSVDLNRGSLAPGLYFYEMLDGNKVISTGKLMIQ